LDAAAEKDDQAYLCWLAEAAGAKACLIHAYVLMTHHVRLLGTPQGVTG